MADVKPLGAIGEAAVEALDLDSRQGTVYGVWLHNSNASLVYLNMYDTEDAIVPGTTPRVAYWEIGPSFTGFVPVEMRFTKELNFNISTAIAGSGPPVVSPVCTLYYNVD